MSDVVFIPDAEAPAPIDPDAHVAAGPFWPDIRLSDFRAAMRIGNSTIPDARVRRALEGALLTVDTDLRLWRQARLSEGFATLADCPSEMFGDRSRLILLYDRAIYAYAAADLVETHRDITATKTGVDKSDSHELTADDHKRNGLQAVRDLKGKRRIKVGLV